MVDGVKLENGDYGVRAIVTGEWSGGMADYLLANSVTELELNDGKGWAGSDILFLCRLPELTSYKIFDLKISCIEPIHILHRLRLLKISTYCRTPVRFFEFPQIERCALEWRPDSTSLFEMFGLKSLFINNYDGRRFTPFTRLINLESLAILNAPLEDLDGIGALTSLRSLRLGNLRKLESLAGIENLLNLTSLDVNTCRGINSIDEVRSLPQLQSLQINNVGNVKSLKPLELLANLETVIFYESTNILDGDLSPLTGKRKLSRVSFRNRRHYSHTREEFGEAYPG